MSLTDEKWPSSTTFDLIQEALKDDAARKDAIKKAGTLFAITLKNADGETSSWYIDLKETGTVGNGLAPAGKQPNVTLNLDDETFALLTAGKASPQALFMKGKLKIKGDVMKATKIEPILKKIQTKAKL